MKSISRCLTRVSRRGSSPVLGSWALRAEESAKMSYRSHCDLCHESYDSDNLITCRSRVRDCCYRWGDSGQARGQRCIEAQRADRGEAPTTQTTEERGSA